MRRVAYAPANFPKFNGRYERNLRIPSVKHRIQKNLMTKLLKRANFGYRTRRADPRNVYRLCNGFFFNCSGALYSNQG